MNAFTTFRPVPDTTPPDTHLFIGGPLRSCSLELAAARSCRGISLV
jgi:hypothetical protein